MKQLLNQNREIARHFKLLLNQMVTFKTGNAMLKQAGQRISDTLRQELGGENKSQNKGEEQTSVGQGCFRPSNKYINHCRIFPMLRKGNGTL